MRNKQGIKTGGRKEEKINGWEGVELRAGRRRRWRSKEDFRFSTFAGAAHKGFAAWSPAKTKVYAFMCTIQEGKKESGRVFDLAVSWIRCRCCVRPKSLPRTAVTATAWRAAARLKMPHSPLLLPLLHPLLHDQQLVVAASCKKKKKTSSCRNRASSLVRF